MTVVEADLDALIVEKDVEVVVRDGITLRVNVFRPRTTQPVPVIVSAHPYGKDVLPKKTRFGWRIDPQYRVWRQAEPITISSLTSWEAPDPVWWTSNGYAVVNADLRGAGTSDGEGDFFSEVEHHDVVDLVEWAAAQSWSTGDVGMLGVSYLAVTQWEAAAHRTPSLKAIVPWEGTTDPYRDVMRPGGIRETGFTFMWSQGNRTVRLARNFIAEAGDHPLHDEFWEAMTPQIDRIEVPVLVCGSFSDQSLHSRGCFRAYEMLKTPHRSLFTHRGGKWGQFYSAPAMQAQLAFLDRFVKRRLDAPESPPVRLEVRRSIDEVTSVRTESQWPPAGTRWRELFFTDAGLSDVSPTTSGSFGYEMRRGAMRIGWTVPDEIESVGPIALRIWVEAHGADDVPLFVGVEKWSDGRYVPFHGPFGFDRDRVATGWGRAALRELDDERTTPHAPEHPFRRRSPLSPGQVVPLEIALPPSATAWRAGDQLRLVVASRWLWSRNPFTGQFPSAYEGATTGSCTVHWGPDRPSRLLIPTSGGRHG